MAYFLSNWDNNGSPPRETHIPATAARCNSGRSKAARAEREPSFLPGRGREPAALSNYLKCWHLRICDYTVTWNLQVTGGANVVHARAWQGSK